MSIRSEIYSAETHAQAEVCEIFIRLIMVAVVTNPGSIDYMHKAKIGEEN